MIRIAIADDHCIIREGLKRLVEQTADIVVVGEAMNGTEALELVRAGQLEILVLDLSMPGRSGIELIHQICVEAPTLPILVLSMYDEEQYAVRAIRAGARGYLSKMRAGSQLILAIRRLAQGRPYLSEVVAEQLAMDAFPRKTLSGHLQLSNREYEVFQLLVSGKTVTEIASQLHLSSKTISTHKTRILDKLNLQSVADLVRYAILHQLGPAHPV